MKIFVDYHSARKVQGVFDLKGKDRLDMMKEIFHLQRFDVEWKAHKKPPEHSWINQRHYQDLKRFRKKPFQL
jgi:hypothetical protein